MFSQTSSHFECGIIDTLIRKNPIKFNVYFFSVLSYDSLFREGGSKLKNIIKLIQKHGAETNTQEGLCKVG